MAEETFEGWCIVELFGHQQIAGLVQEQAIGGASFVRVDVPAVEGGEAFTKLYGAGAIYAITPTTEEIARIAAARLRIRPVSPYVVPVPARLAAGAPGMDGYEYEGAEEEDEEDIEPFSFGSGDV